MPLEVDFELARPDELGLVRLQASPSQEGLGTRHQLLRVERLGQVIVRADLQPDDLVGDLVAGGQHDDRHLALLPDLLAQGEPVGAGQHDVEDHQVGLDLAEASHRLRPIPHSLHVVPLAGEVQASQLEDVRLVIDDQDLEAQCRHTINTSPTRHRVVQVT